MQRTNNSQEEDPALLVARQLYRLQALRHLLVVILMIQIMLMGIGLTLVLRGQSLAPVLMQSNPNNPANGREHNGFGFQPNEIHRDPEKRQIIVDDETCLRALRVVATFPCYERSMTPVSPTPTAPL